MTQCASSVCRTQYKQQCNSRVIIVHYTTHIFDLFSLWHSNLSLVDGNNCDMKLLDSKHDSPNRYVDVDEQLK